MNICDSYFAELSLKLQL